MFTTNPYDTCVTVGHAVATLAPLNTAQSLYVDLVCQHFADAPYDGQYFSPLTYQVAHKQSPLNQFRQSLETTCHQTEGVMFGVTREEALAFQRYNQTLAVVGQDQKPAMEQSLRAMCVASLHAETGEEVYAAVHSKVMTPYTRSLLAKSVYAMVEADQARFNLSGPAMP